MNPKTKNFWYDSFLKHQFIIKLNFGFRFSISHEIKQTMAEEKDLMAVINEDIKFETLFFIAIILYTLFIVGLSYFQNERGKKKIKTARILENLIDFRADFKYPVTKIGLHLILFEIFTMFSTKIFT